MQALSCFSCLLRPKKGRQPKNNTWTRGPDDIETHLAFFSTFEELKLPATRPKDHATTKLYEQSPAPILYIGSCDLMLAGCHSFPCSCMATLLHHTLQVATPQGQRIPVRNRRRSCSGWSQGEQRIRGQPVAVAVWTGEASTEGSVGV
jgi:hypothetical protein